jgi:hypothetical protein
VKEIRCLRDHELIPDYPVKRVRVPEGLGALYVSLFWKLINEEYRIWQLWQFDLLWAISPRIAFGIEIQRQDHLGIEAPRRLVLYIMCFIFGLCVRPAHYFAKERSAVEAGPFWEGTRKRIREGRPSYRTEVPEQFANDRGGV